MPKSRRDYGPDRCKKRAIITTQTKFDADELNIITPAQKCSDDDNPAHYLNHYLNHLWRRPNGPACPHCKHDEVYQLTSKPDRKSKVRPGLYCCAACQKLGSGMITFPMNGLNSSFAIDPDLSTI